MKERVPVSGRTAVIGGAGSGIGRALAVRLARYGCPVALTDWDETGLEETAALIDGPVLTRVLDVGDRDAQLRGPTTSSPGHRHRWGWWSTTPESSSPGGRQRPTTRTTSGHWGVRS